MAYKGKFEASVDASYGLVMRLNYLWSMVDRKALAGNLDEWNFVLDRIYCNLLYRNNLQAVLNNEGDIIDVKLNEDASKVYDVFSKKIARIKFDMKLAVTKRRVLLYRQKKEELYKLLMLKDTWLRKFMQELGLYLKELEFNPATAMFGGGK